MSSLADRLAANLGSGVLQIILGARGCLDGFFEREFPERLALAGISSSRLVRVDAAIGHSGQTLRRTVLAHLADGGRYAVIVRNGQALCEDAFAALCGIAARGGADVFVEAASSSVERLAKAPLGSGRAVLHRDFEHAEAFWKEGSAGEALEALVQELAQSRHLRRSVLMLDLLRYFASTMGEPHSANSVAADMTRLGHPVSDKTVKAMIGALEEALLIIRVPSWDIRARAERRTPERIYPAAASLAALLCPDADCGSVRRLELVLAMRSAGWRVVSPFLSVVDRSKEGRAVRSRLEADFLCTRGSASIYVRWEKKLDPVTADRAECVRSLLRIPDLFEKLIVTEGAFAPWRTRRGVRVMGIGDFTGLIRRKPRI